MVTRWFFAVTGVAAALALAAGCEETRERDRDGRGITRPEIGGGRTETAAPYYGPTAAPGATAAPAPGTAAAPGAAGTGAGAEVGEREMDARFKAVEGYKLDGRVELEEQAGGVMIKVEVNDAPPGAHAVELHERGDCSDPAGKSFGEMLGMTAAGEKGEAYRGEPDTAPEALERGIEKAGDAAERAAEKATGEAHEHGLGYLGNIQVGEDGKGRLEKFVAGATLAPGQASSLANRAVVLHQKGFTGKMGSEGAAIACGVIEERGLLD